MAALCSSFPPKSRSLFQRNSGDYQVKCSDGGTESIKASWNLRTYLNFPWGALISIEGATIYNLNEELKIIRHAETWNVSPIEAISQIFRLSNLRQ